MILDDQRRQLLYDDVRNDLVFVTRERVCLNESEREGGGKREKEKQGVCERERV